MKKCSNWQVLVYLKIHVLKVYSYKLIELKLLLKETYSYENNASSKKPKKKKKKIVKAYL